MYSRCGTRRTARRSASIPRCSAAASNWVSAAARAFCPAVPGAGARAVGACGDVRGHGWSPGGVAGVTNGHTASPRPGNVGGDRHERRVNNGPASHARVVHEGPIAAGLCSSACRPSPRSADVRLASRSATQLDRRPVAAAPRRAHARPALGDRSGARAPVRRRAAPTSARGSPPRLLARPRRPRARPGDAAEQPRHPVGGDDARPPVRGRRPARRGEHPAGRAGRPADRPAVHDRPRAPDAAHRRPHQRGPPARAHGRADRGAAPGAAGGDRAQRGADAAARGRHPGAVPLPVREREPPAPPVQRRRPWPTRRSPSIAPLAAKRDQRIERSLRRIRRPPRVRRPPAAGAGAAQPGLQRPALRARTAGPSRSAWRSTGCSRAGA